jgi:glycosyltransferase involved in cell wall biosynthesis
MTREALLQKSRDCVRFGRICYTGLPRIFGQATWGKAAYAFGGKFLKRLNQEMRFDIVHAHFAIASGHVAQLVADEGGPPFVVSIHGYEVAFTAKRPGGKAVLRRVLGSARAVIANSSRTRDRILELGNVDPGLVRIIYQGGDCEAENDVPLVKIEHHSEEFQVLTVGGLERQKGQDVVLRAAARLNRGGFPVRCTFIGEGNDLPRLQRLVRELGLGGQVVFTGPVPPQRMGKYYEACNAFVLPSWNEAFGVAYVEAMHYGKPVVGLVGEGGPEDLARLGAGIVRIPRDDDAVLASIISRWIRLPAEAEEMGRRNRDLARRELTWACHARKLMKLYEEILNGKCLQDAMSV